ncbi:MAG: Hsp33 family molecular chaperone HslO [Firmicutes bacterium]|nr:Hsp33 family molecular chaperone HslO [Bacillota bacterium]
MNKVLTAIDKSGSFRVYLTISTKLVQEALNIHNTTPVATAALGRVLTGAGMMGLMLKNERDKLTLIFKGDGPARQILATADGKGNVKGYIADPGVDLPLKENGKLDVGGAIGRGELTVVKDLGLKEPYVGTVSLVSGEIAEDLTSYYYISEQQNTAISLGVKIERDYSVGCAGGMIVQLLPDASEDAVAALEKIIGDMEPITTLIDRVKGGGTDERLRLLSKEIFGRIPEEFAIEELEIKNMDWNCDCSFERLEKILMTIGERDLKEIIEEDGEAELVCQFCLKKYKFDKAHLEKILASIR